MTMIKEFEQSYTQKGKHRKRCLVCRKLIQDGESATFALIETEKYYPVKGLMTFRNWKVKHTEC